MTSDQLQEPSYLVTTTVNEILVKQESKITRAQE